MMRKRIAVIAVIFEVVLAGCSTTPEPTPTPTQTPTPTPTSTPKPSPTVTELTPEQQARQTNEAAAKERLKEYNAAVDQWAINDYIGWEELIAPYIQDPKLMASYAELENSDTPWIRSGETVLKWMKVTEYIPDPTGASHERITISVCMDSSGVIQKEADGTPVPNPEGWDPVVSRIYEMGRYDATQPWVIVKDLGREGPCE